MPSVCPDMTSVRANNVTLHNDTLLSYMYSVGVQKFFMDDF